MTEHPFVRIEQETYLTFLDQFDEVTRRVEGPVPYMLTHEHRRARNRVGPIAFAFGTSTNRLKEMRDWLKGNTIKFYMHRPAFTTESYIEFWDEKDATLFLLHFG